AGGVDPPGSPPVVGACGAGTFGAGGWAVAVFLPPFPSAKARPPMSATKPTAPPIMIHFFRPDGSDTFRSPLARRAELPAGFVAAARAFRVLAAPRAVFPDRAAASHGASASITTFADW